LREPSPDVRSRNARRLGLHHDERSQRYAYTGVTAGLARRAYEHREGLYVGFTKRYALSRLVWYEFHENITAAIQRESNMKHWPRAWKVRLILAMNPEWRDLYLDLNS